MDAQHPRRIFSRVILCGSLALALVGLSQCRTVSDNVTGLDLNQTASIDDANGNGHGHGKCVHDCRKNYQQGIKAENRRFRDALKHCGGNATCRKSEVARHQNVVLDLRNRERDCRSHCYNEGAGMGGR